GPSEDAGHRRGHMVRDGATRLLTMRGEHFVLRFKPGLLQAGLEIRAAAFSSSKASDANAVAVCFSTPSIMSGLDHAGPADQALACRLQADISQCYREMGGAGGPGGTVAVTGGGTADVVAGALADGSGAVAAEAGGAAGVTGGTGSGRSGLSSLPTFSLGGSTLAVSGGLLSRARSP